MTLKVKAEICLVYLDPGVLSQTILCFTLQFYLYLPYIGKQLGDNLHGSSYSHTSFPF